MGALTRVRAQARSHTLMPDPLFAGRGHGRRRAFQVPRWHGKLPGMLNLPDKPDWVVVDIEAGGLFYDDGARIGSVGVGWVEAGEVHALALPFDQGVRDKFPWMQMDLFT